MNEPLLNSVTVIGAALVAVAAVILIHWSALRICPSNRRFHYLVIFLCIAVPSMFIVIVQGSAKFQPVILWDCYHMMALRVFQYNPKGFGDYDWGFFGLPVLHQLVAAFASAFLARRMPDFSKQEGGSE